jgi:Domain of unknown function (DUF2017)
VAKLRDDRRIRRSRKGGFELRIPEPEREVLRQLPEQLLEIHGSDDPVLERLFPAAYPDDAEHEREFRDMTHDDLRRQREDALQVMSRTIEAERLSEEELLAWLSAINDARLVLGLRLDVTEELDISQIPDDDPRASMFGLYGYLTWLEEQAVGALSASL